MARPAVPAKPPVTRNQILTFVAILWAAVLIVACVLLADWWGKGAGTQWRAARGVVDEIACKGRAGTVWRYRYRVEGAEYAASYAYEGCERSALFALWVRRERAPVAVFYDPADPARSVLERRPPFPWTRFFGVVLVLGAPALLFTLGARRDLRAMPSTSSTGSAGGRPRTPSR